MATISKADYEKLIEQAKAAYPDESCGLLLGSRSANGIEIVRFRRMRNASESPRSGFTFDPREQLEAMRAARRAGLEIVGHYHSHPNGRRGPSPTDLSMARTHFDRDLWLIIAVEDSKYVEGGVWRLEGDPGEFVKLELKINDD